MSDEPKSVYERARIAAGIDTVGDHTDAFMSSATEDGGLADDQRLKARYCYVLGKLEVCSEDNEEKWHQKRRRLEDELMDAGIKPSTLA